MSRKIAFSGICTALCVIFLYLSNIFTLNTLFLLGFSSIFIAIVLVECSYTYAFLCFIASALLGLFILPNKFLILPFAFLGLYTIAKSFIERIGKLSFEWLLKILYFLVTVILLSGLFLSQISLPLYAVYIGGVAVLCVYDIALSVGITYFKKTFKIFSKKH